MGGAERYCAECDRFFPEGQERHAYHSAENYKLKRRSRMARVYWHARLTTVLWQVPKEDSDLMHCGVRFE